MSRKVLVTGAAGFIGSQLAKALAEAGNEVVGIDNLSSGSKKLVDAISSDNFKFIETDCNSKEFVEKASKEKFYAILHYAATVGVKTTLENPLKVLKDIDGIRNVLEVAKKNKSKVIFASSSEVYGEPLEIPQKETSPLNGTITYDVVKLVGEKYMEAYAKEFGLSTCSLRIFNTYGPGQRSSEYGFVVGIFIQQALKNEKLTVFGEGTQTRDFTFVEDHVKAVTSLMDKDFSGEVINVGTGKETSINELARKIVKISGSKSEIKNLDARGFEIKRRLADVSKLKEICGFVPETELEEGLKKTIEWFKQND